MLVSLPPSGWQEYTAASKRVPARSSQGFCPAPCCCAEQKDWSQLLLAHGDGVSQQGRSELSLWALLAAGGLCCRSPRSKSPEVLLWRNTNRDLAGTSRHLPRCAVGRLQWPARCHLDCAKTHRMEPAEEGNGGWKGRECPTPPLVFTCSVFTLESHCTWFHAHGPWSLGGSYSSVKSDSCSVVRPLLPCTQSHFPGSLSPVKCSGEHSGLPSRAGLACASGSRGSYLCARPRNSPFLFSTCLGPCGLGGSSQGS